MENEKFSNQKIEDRLIDSLISVNDLGTEAERREKLRGMYFSDLMSRARSKLFANKKSTYAFSVLPSSVIKQNINNLQMFTSQMVGISSQNEQGDFCYRNDPCMSSISSCLVAHELPLVPQADEAGRKAIAFKRFSSMIFRAYKIRSDREIGGSDRFSTILENLRVATEKMSRTNPFILYANRGRTLEETTDYFPIHDVIPYIRLDNPYLELSKVIGRMKSVAPFNNGQFYTPPKDSGNYMLWANNFADHIFNYFNSDTSIFTTKLKELCRKLGLHWFTMLFRGLSFAIINHFPLGNMAVNFVTVNHDIIKDNDVGINFEPNFYIHGIVQDAVISPEAFNDVIGTVPLSWIRNEKDLKYAFWLGLCLKGWRTPCIKFGFSSSVQSPDNARVTLYYTNGASMTVKLGEKFFRDEYPLRELADGKFCTSEGAYVSKNISTFGLTTFTGAVTGLDRVINFQFSNRVLSKKQVATFKKELKLIANLLTDDNSIFDILQLLKVRNYADSDDGDLNDRFSSKGFFSIKSKISDLNSDQIIVFRDALMALDLQLETDNYLPLTSVVKEKIVDTVKGLYTRGKMDEYETVIETIDDQFSAFSEKYKSLATGFSSSSPNNGENVIAKTSEGESLIKEFFHSIRDFASYAGIAIDADANTSFGDPVLKYKFWISQFRDKFIQWNEDRVKDFAGLVEIPKDKYEKTIEVLMAAANLNDIKIPLPSAALVKDIFFGIVKSVAKGFYNTMAVIENVYNIFDSVYNNFVVNKRFIPVTSTDLTSDRNEYVLMVYPSTLGVNPSRLFRDQEVNEGLVDFGFNGDSNEYVGRLIRVDDAIIANYANSGLKGKDLFLSMLAGRSNPVKYYYKPGFHEHGVATGVVLAQAGVAGAAAAASAKGPWFVKVIAASVAAGAVFAINAAKRIEMNSNFFPNYYDSKGVLHERWRDKLDYETTHRIFLWNAACIYGMPGSNLKLAQRISLDAMAIAGGFVATAAVGAGIGLATSSIAQFTRKMKIKKDYKKKNTMINLPNGVQGNYNDLKWREKQAAVQWAMFNKDPRNYGKAIAGLSSGTSNAIKDALGDLDSGVDFSKSYFNKMFNNQDDEMSKEFNKLGKNIKDLKQLNIDNHKSLNDKMIVSLTETSAIAAGIIDLKAHNSKISTWLKLIINRLGG